MPSVSQRQQRFFGSVLGGAAKKPKGMTMGQVRDFAATSRRGLPEHMADGGGNWMQRAFKDSGKPGHSLHASLGISKDKKIPVSKVESASHGDDAKVRHQAQAALNASGFRARR